MKRIALKSRTRLLWDPSVWDEYAVDLQTVTKADADTNAWGAYLCGFFLGEMTVLLVMWFCR